MVERRHEVEIGDALALDQRQRGAGVEPRQADERAADERHGEQRAHAHRVVERHHAERALAAARRGSARLRDRGRALGAVPARHALGPRGRARGVEHQRPGLGVRRAASRRRLLSSKRRKVEVRRTAAPPTAMRGKAPARAAPRSTAACGNVLVDDRAGFGIRRRRNRARRPSARQFSGMMMMPANWQAQCSVPPRQRFCSTVTSVAGLDAELVEGRRPATKSCAYHCRIGQPDGAVDDGSRSGSRSTLARKLLPRSSMAALPRPRAPPKRRSHDRRVAGAAAQMAGKQCAISGSLASGRSRRQRLERHQDPRRAEAALQSRDCSRKASCNAESRPAPAPGLRRYECPPLPPGPQARGRSGPARPSICTVQAPQTPCSQPTCVPVAPSTWRRKSLSSMRGSAWPETVRPLSVKLTRCSAACAQARHRAAVSSVCRPMRRTSWRR